MTDTRQFPTQQYRLLLVDDDATDRRAIRKLLSELGGLGSLTQEADCGAAGLAALRSGPFDCVLLDFNLPDMSGLEFLAAANGEHGLPCGVVLVTGQGNEAIAVDVMKAGAQDYLVKDQLNASNLWRAVTRAVTQIELQRRLTDSLRDLTDTNLALEQEIATRTAAEADLLAAKESAEQANMAKTRFVAMITHELRTPLNGIMGYAQLLEVEGGLNPRQTAHVGTMKQASRSLLELIERVLDFSSIESGRMKLHLMETSVRSLAEDCIASMSPLATDRGLSLRMVQSHDCPRHIVTDPARLRQVLVNLLGNALKYTDYGSVELRLLAGASPGSLRAEIVDTGHGVSEANRDRLFVDFERFDAATSVEGTGLGLAIASRIVGLLGGKIEYSPNPDGIEPNSGSIFWFELPSAEIAPPEVRTVPATALSALRGQHVLLVDDIMINRDIIGDFLKAAGHMVTLASSGAEAIRLAGEQQFDLILMDVRMPEMDGMEATRHIRALPGAHGQIPILALTAHTFPDQLTQCREATMNGHISKPVDYHTLIETIEWAIRGGEPTADNPATRLQTASPPGGRPRAELDRTVLSRLLALLPRDEIIVILHSLRERQQEMLRLMDQDASPVLLADVAHALTATASIFGFMTLAGRARDYECALTQNDPATGQLTQDLRAEIDVALPTLNAIICEIQVQPI